jgi:hypothetical protein
MIVSLLMGIVFILAGFLILKFIYGLDFKLLKQLLKDTLVMFLALIPITLIIVGFSVIYINCLKDFWGK